MLCQEAGERALVFCACAGCGLFELINLKLNNSNILFKRIPMLISFLLFFRIFISVAGELSCCKTDEGRDANEQNIIGGFRI